MEGIDAGAAVVGVTALSGIKEDVETAPTVVVVAVAMVEERKIEVSATMIRVEDLEAGALVIGGEVEALLVGGIGVQQLGRTVRRGGQKLSSGTGKKSRGEMLVIMILVIRIIITMTTMEMILRPMGEITMTKHGSN